MSDYFILQTNVVGMLCGMPWDKMFEQIRRVYGIDGLAPALNANGGGLHEIKILVYEDTDATDVD